MIKNYLFSIYHHQIACIDIAISKSLQWRLLTHAYYWEKNVWLHNPKNQAVHVCVYNAGWEGKEGGEKRGMSPIKFM